jgi:hypothetical protein
MTRILDILILIVQLISNTIELLIFLIKYIILNVIYNIKLLIIKLNYKFYGIDKRSKRKEIIEIKTKDEEGNEKIIKRDLYIIEGDNEEDLNLAEEDRLHTITYMCNTVIILFLSLIEEIKHLFTVNKDNMLDHILLLVTIVFIIIIFKYL